MKLIAEADQNPELFSIKISCTGARWNQDNRTPCGRLWELNATDILKRNYTDYAGGSETYYGFVCPKCGCFTEIQSSELKGFPMSMAKSYVKPVYKDSNDMGY